MDAINIYGFSQLELKLGIRRPAFILLAAPRVVSILAAEPDRHAGIARKVFLLRASARDSVRI